MVRESIFMNCRLAKCETRRAVGNVSFEFPQFILKEEDDKRTKPALARIAAINKSKSFAARRHRFVCDLINTKGLGCNGTALFFRRQLLEMCLHDIPANRVAHPKTKPVSKPSNDCFALCQEKRWRIN